MVPEAAIAIVDAAVVVVALVVEAVAEETNMAVVLVTAIMTRNVKIADNMAIFNVHITSTEVVMLTTEKPPTTPTRNFQEWTLVPFVAPLMALSHVTAHYPTGHLSSGAVCVGIGVTIFVQPIQTPML